MERIKVSDLDLSMIELSWVKLVRMFKGEGLRVIADKIDENLNISILDESKQCSIYFFSIVNE